MHAKFEAIASPVPDIWRVSKISKLGHETLADPFDLILHFSVSAPCVLYACQI